MGIDWNSAGGASLISAGAGILGGAFGGDGVNTARGQSSWAADLQGRMDKRNMRYYRRHLEKAPSAMVKGAREAGLHPLFAMGASGYTPPASGGSAGIPGQSPSGSFARDALSELSRHFLRVSEMRAAGDLIDAQNRRSILSKQENASSNDTQQALADQYVLDKDQELKKGEVMAYEKRHPEQNKNVISPMTKMRIGSQTLQIPVEEADTIMEDPVAAAAAAYTYHGNKNIDWPLLFQEYRHGTAATPRQVTGGTKRMFERMEKLHAERRSAKRRSAKKYRTWDDLNHPPGRHHF